MKQFSKALGIIIVSCALGVLSNCDKKGGKKDTPAESSGTSNINVSLKSSKVTSLTTLIAEGCSCGTPGTGNGGPLCDGGGDGKCYSPTAFKGHFNKLTISNIAGAYARLLGGGNKYHGLEGEFRTAFFDVTKPVFYDGDDNIQDNTGVSKFDMATLQMQTVEYQFAAVGKFFNIRVPAVHYPVTSDPKFVGCVDEAGLGDSAKYVKLFDSDKTISVGDILVCLKSAKTDTCLDSEYVWVDSSTGETAATRPTSPVRFSGSSFGTASTCTAGAEHPEVTWGNVDFLVNLDAAPFEVTAKFDAGKKLYTSGGSSGNTMDVTVDLDASNQIFVPNDLVTAFTTTTAHVTYEALLLKNLSKITLRGLYDHNTRATTSVNIDKANWLVGKISVAISDKSEEEDGDVEDLSDTLPSQTKLVR